MKFIFKNFINGMKRVANSLPSNHPIKKEEFNLWYEKLIDYYQFNKTFSSTQDTPVSLSREEVFMNCYQTIVVHAKDTKLFVQVLNTLLKDILHTHPEDSTAIQIFDTFYIIARYNGYY